MHALNHIREEGGHVLADGHRRYDCDRISPSFISKWPFRLNYLSLQLVFVPANQYVVVRRAIQQFRLEKKEVSFRLLL